MFNLDTYLLSIANVANIGPKDVCMDSVSFR